MSTLIAVEELAGPAVVGRGGHVMHVVQILEGLKRLGHEVLFVEYLSEPPEPEAVAHFANELTRWWDLASSALVLATTGESLCGLDAGEVARVAARADAVLTLAAPYRAEPWPMLEEVRPRILMENDPAYTHLWAAEGDPAEIYGRHDAYFTVGANIGTAGCGVPTSGIEWRTAWNPVVVDWWEPATPPTADRFTTVGAWRDYGYLEFEGRLLGPKVEEFEHFIDVPRLSGETPEMVLSIDPDDPDLPRLRSHGWLVAPPETVSTAERYRRYVTASAGELSCAKGGYVGTRCGWFSDRSACYLAAGRPVVCQATGFEDHLPTGEGLFAVRDGEEAAEAMAAIRREPRRHSEAARAIAVEYFDTATVLAPVLASVGVGF